MRIVNIVAALQNASGITTFLKEVERELLAKGVEVETKVGSFEKKDIDSCDIVHIHGLWTPTLHRAVVYARKIGKPYVISPHGMSQKWALRNKWWKKLAALVLYQWWDLMKADLIHVTAESEVEDVRRLGLKNEIVIAPLGVRVLGVEKKGEGEQKKTLLFVSRVQRKKGLPNLIEAWSRLSEGLKKDWTIRIVGPDEDGHTAELMAQCERLGLSYLDREGEIHCPTPTNNSHSMQPQVVFVGPKYDDELDLEYWNADLFVLPTHSENFGSVVIEALARSVPVICTKEAPWEELETHKCGWWIDDSIAAIEDSLISALKTPSSTLEEMGKRGRSLVESKYTWSAVAKTLIEAYERL